MFLNYEKMTGRTVKTTIGTIFGTSKAIHLFFSELLENYSEAGEDDHEEDDGEEEC